MNYKTFLWKAITSEYPNCKFVLDMNDVNVLDTVNWSEENTEPFDKNRIETKIAELEAAEPLRLLRIQRNQLLQESDWRDLPSYPGTDQAEWRTYRQALRDLTNTETPALNNNGELINVNWPVPPGESNGS